MGAVGYIIYKVYYIKRDNPSVFRLRRNPPPFTQGRLPWSVRYLRCAYEQTVRHGGKAAPRAVNKENLRFLNRQPRLPSVCGYWRDDFLSGREQKRMPYCMYGRAFWACTAEKRPPRAVNKGVDGVAKYKSAPAGAGALYRKG